MASENPLSRAGIIAQITFSWVSKIFGKGETLQEKDLYRLLSRDESQTCTAQLRREWEAELRRSPKAPSLARAYVRAFGPWYLSISVFIMWKACCVLAQSQFLALLLTALADPSADTTHLYLLVLGLALTASVGGLLHHVFFFQAWRAGMHWKAAAQGLIFDKILRLRLDTLSSGELSAGQITNLAGSDLERFQKLCQMGAYVVVAPLEAAVILWLLWREVGIAALCGAALMVFFVFLQSGFLSRQTYKLRAAIARVTDERVRLQGQVIAGIRALKLYAWEPPYARAVQEVRGRESALLSQASIYKGTNEGLANITSVLICGATFLSAWALGMPLSPRNVFVTQALFGFLQVEITRFFPLAIEALGETAVCIKRMEQFLLAPDSEAGVPRDALPAADASGSSIDAPVIQVRSASCVWPATAAESHKAAAPGALAAAVQQESGFGLHDVEFTVKRGQFVAIVGAVGAGKSTLLSLLLRELQPSAGTVQVLGSVAYAPQAAWVLTGSVRDNITVGKEWDEAKYAAAIHASCLGPDLSRLPDGDSTMLGERGVNLSGGQKARLSLARTIYLQGDVTILDDPFAALDSRVGRALYHRCVGPKGILASRGCTRVLVTHALQYVRQADRIIVMHKGRVAAQGSFDMLAAAWKAQTEGDAASAASAFAAVGGTDAVSQGDLGAALADLFGAQQDNDSGAGVGNEVGTVAGGSAEDGDGKVDYDDAELLKAVANEEGSQYASFPSTPMPAVSPVPATSSTPAAGKGKEASSGNGAEDGADKDSKKAGKDRNSVISAEKVATGVVKSNVYVEYLRAAGGLWPTAVAVGTLLLGTASILLNSSWLALWCAQPLDTQRGSFYPAVYGGLLCAALVLGIGRAVHFNWVAVRASQTLHNAAFAKLLTGTATFFAANPAGRLLNVLAKDVGLTDEYVPFVAFDFLAISAMVVGILLLVVIVNPWLLLVLAPLVVVFFKLRAYYMLTARVVKRIESTTRSPIFCLMQEVLSGSGLPTVRAFGLQDILRTRFATAVDANVRAYFMFLATSRWLGVRLDFISLALFIVTAFVCVPVRASLAPGLVGLMLSQLQLVTNSLQWGVRQSSELENAMIAVERILNYARDLGPPDTEEVDIAGAVEEGKEGSQKQGKAADKDTVLVVQDTGTISTKEADASMSMVDNPMAESMRGRDASGVVDPPPDWPSAGAVELDGLWMQYRPGLPYVLRGVSASIPAGCRVGIVGRTGAGKSSLYLALLRLIEPARHPLPKDLMEAQGKGEGAKQVQDKSTTAPGEIGVRIDGIDVGLVHLTRLRRCVSVIPQDPVLFAGSLRSNIDPWGSHSDEQCKAALQAAQLGHVDLRLPVSEGGSNLSIGQRQLVCLARALLRRSRLVLVDEATASVDSDTDAAVQAALRNLFKPQGEGAGVVGTTALIIAHRLSTVLDCDLVLVMDAGRVVQAGPPQQLAAVQGPFADLLQGAKH